jgi:hypothetical protein
MSFTATLSFKSSVVIARGVVIYVRSPKPAVHGGQVHACALRTYPARPRWAAVAEGLGLCIIQLATALAAAALSAWRGDHYMVDLQQRFCQPRSEREKERR